MQDRHDKAETFFEAATAFEPRSVLAWTMLCMSTKQKLPGTTFCQASQLLY